MICLKSSSWTVNEEAELKAPLKTGFWLGFFVTGGYRSL